MDTHDLASPKRRRLCKPCAPEVAVPLARPPPQESASFSGLPSSCMATIHTFCGEPALEAVSRTSFLATEEAYAAWTTAACRDYVVSFLLTPSMAQTSQTYLRAYALFRVMFRRRSELVYGFMLPILRNWLRNSYTGHGTCFLEMLSWMLKPTHAFYAGCVPYHGHHHARQSWFLHGVLSAFPGAPNSSDEASIRSRKQDLIDVWLRPFAAELEAHGPGAPCLSVTRADASLPLLLAGIMGSLFGYNAQAVLATFSRPFGLRDHDPDQVGLCLVLCSTEVVEAVVTSAAMAAAAIHWRSKVVLAIWKYALERRKSKAAAAALEAACFRECACAMDGVRAAWGRAKAKSSSKAAQAFLVRIRPALGFVDG
jgi:hypothetical protein